MYMKKAQWYINRDLNIVCVIIHFKGPTLTYIKKPLVAAISGYAVAGGLELALLCDLRVIEETAIVGVYNRRFGLFLM